MTTHAITAVRVSEKTGRVTHVMWGRLTHDGTGYEVEPRPAPVIDGVNALGDGDTVVSVCRLGGQRVAGPTGGLVVYPGGSEPGETVVRGQTPSSTAPGGR